jgi:hypothetical protein
MGQKAVTFSIWVKCFTGKEKILGPRTATHYKGGQLDSIEGIRKRESYLLCKHFSVNLSGTCSL